MDQGSTMKRSAVHNFAPTVTKFCVMWEGQALPHDTKFGNSRCEIVGRRVIFIWSLIHGLRWSGLIKAEPDVCVGIHNDGGLFLLQVEVRAFPQRGLFSVAVETAFPQCAIVQLQDRQVKRNCEVISKLQTGEAYDGGVLHGVRVGCLIAGSRAEGLAIESGWGHPMADEDNMELYGGLLGVHIPQGRQPPGSSTLRYRPKACLPAYCKIEVTDVEALMGVGLDTKCVHRSDSVAWLHTYNTLRRMQGDSITGPAGQAYGGLHKYVPTLVCNDAHPDVDWNYVSRPRYGWPSLQQLGVIKQLAMLIVMIGHKQSPPDEIPLQARLSCSPAGRRHS